ncbi:CDP-glucose 4,6-dehydratase, partial [Pseudomonas amygdali]|nr:CDP-glucose 4,6-dehydratase [Pseudomonas amygdali]
MTAKLKFEDSLAGKKVLVTGHTGFTGGWACLWLKSIGAHVAGYSLAPETTPSLFEELVWCFT